jgi:hypothetical protein
MQENPMSNPYHGTWRIIEMEQWDQDYIDLVVPGYISFREDNQGEFQFGTVHGDIDYRVEPYQETERLEFSWEGEDEMDPVSGRGWAILRMDNSREGSTFTKGMSQGLWQKKMDEGTGGAVETRCERPVVVENPEVTGTSQGIQQAERLSCYPCLGYAKTDGAVNP